MTDGCFKKTYHTFSAILKHDGIFIVSNLLGVSRVLFSIIPQAVADLVSKLNHLDRLGEIVDTDKSLKNSVILTFSYTHTFISLGSFKLAYTATVNKYRCPTGTR